MYIVQAKPLSQIWLKASVIGSIWASIEIILGSFLHNLKIPLSGMVLSFISVWLLIAFLQLWKENGIIWKAGLICALMKSISPSAFILGPMIGIFTEALLLELFIFLLGKNLLGFMIGGSFAVLSSIIHKLVSLLILYGFDFIKILSDLYLFSAKQIDLEKLKPSSLIILIVIIYIVAGMTAAVAGFITGRRYLNNTSIKSKSISLNSRNLFSEVKMNQPYSVFFLSVNLMSIITILLLLNNDYLLPAIFSSVIYIGFCIWKYKKSLSRLKKFSFWISFIIITFAAAFLWNGFSNGAFFSTTGLIIGLKMNARAIILVIGFASISVELKNPIIKSVLYNKGFANLYQALSLAFSALPFFLSNLSVKGRNNTETALKSLLSQAENLLIIFKNEHHKRARVVIITGDIQQGKTTFTERIVSDLSDEKFKIEGFLSKGINYEGKRTGFNLVDIRSTEEMELCSDKKYETKVKLGNYYFNNDAIIFGNKILSSENIQKADLIVIDELGPLELKGLGWTNSIEVLTGNFSIPQLWVVRKKLVEKMSTRWNIGDAYIYDISKSSVRDVEIKIRELINDNAREHKG